MTTSKHTREEKACTGTAEWQLQWTRFDSVPALASTPLVRNLRSSAVEGFGSRTSCYPGESVDFFVSLDPEGSVNIDIYRLGYYGGLGGKLMTSLGPFNVPTQPVPMMTTERLRECDWEKTLTFDVPNDWGSGVYLAKLTRDEEFGPQSYIIFVVKERRESDILFQVSDLTWQAYNK
ncbi:MAG: N,N-dimethylformamidase beta subunit family domain-containing protein, partial [Candidatus Latescibacterota bacterium]|nr:N,N-dimethylformamidase beta subunit family domain-containing protein [Candidatus Latescibacterota bacterium]